MPAGKQDLPNPSLKKSAAAFVSLFIESGLPHGLKFDMRRRVNPGSQPIPFLQFEAETHEFANLSFRRRIYRLLVPLSLFALRHADHQFFIGHFGWARLEFRP